MEKKLSEKEITNRIQELIYTFDIEIKKHGGHDDLFELDKEALQGLLDLYKQEKEKNRQSKMRIVQLENEITARIEDVNKYFISKDKIKEKATYLCQRYNIYEDYFIVEKVIDILDELLGDDGTVIKKE